MQLAFFVEQTFSIIKTKVVDSDDGDKQRDLSAFLGAGQLGIHSKSAPKKRPAR